MKKTLKIVLLTCLILIACSLAACDNSSEPQTPAHVHSYSEWTVTKAATCTVDGIKERDCSCGDIQKEAVPATGHTLGNWEITKEATCTVDGIEERACACGEKESRAISATGHSFGDWAVSKEATCTVDGVEEKACKCGEKESRAISATGHSFGDWAVSKEATCTSLGEQFAVCSNCNEKKTEDIPVSNNHQYDDGTVTKEPTCTNKGSKTITCTLCKKTEVQEIPALGHSLDSTSKCKTCGLVSLNMTDKQIENSKKVASMSHSVYDYSDEIKISISFDDEDGYSVYAPAYVKIKIDDANGSTVYEKTLIMKDSQSSVSVDHSEFSSYTATGTVYYTVFNDYFSFEEVSHELENMPWTIDIELPDLPTTIKYYNWDDSIDSSCKITGITYERYSDDCVTFYFTGEKTYDDDGNNYSDSCKVGWKLYDEEGYVVASGTLYTDNLAVGEKFKNAETTAYNCIEPGKKYILELLNVQ